MGNAAVHKVVMAVESVEMDALEKVKDFDVAVTRDEEDLWAGGEGGGHLHSFLHCVEHQAIVHHHVLPCHCVPQPQLVVCSEGHEVEAIWGEVEAVHHAVMCHFG